MSLEQIEEHLVKSILRGTLALHVLRNSRKPASKLIHDLLEIEMQVSQFVGHTTRVHAKELKDTLQKGALANVFSFMPISGDHWTQPPLPSQKTKDTSLSKQKEKLKRKARPLSSRQKLQKK